MHRHSIRDNSNVPLACSRLCKIERRIPGNKRDTVSALFPRKPRPVMIIGLEFLPR
jgi:hypothetical protein